VKISGNVEKIALNFCLFDYFLYISFLKACLFCYIIKLLNAKYATA